LIFHVSVWFFSQFIIANFILHLLIHFYAGDLSTCNESEVYYNEPPGENPQEIINAVHQISGLCVGYNVTMSLACFFAWYFLLYFTRGFPNLGLFAVSLHAMLSRNMFPFSIIFFILLMAFSLGYFLIWSSDVWMNSFGVAMLTTLEIALFSTNFEVEDLYNAAPSSLVVIFFILTLFILGVLMINMLIASMGNTYELIRDEAKDQLFFEWTSSVLLIERRIAIFMIVFCVKFDQGITLPERKGVHFRVEEEEEPE